MIPLEVAAAYFYVFVAPAAALTAALLAGEGRRLKWAGLCFLMPLFLPWLLARRARGADVDGPKGSPRPAPTPIAEPGEADVADLRAPVTACPDCGFLGVRPPGVGDGVWPGGGELIGVVCPRCQYRGLPLVFDSGGDYRDYVAQLQPGAV